LNKRQSNYSRRTGIRLIASSLTVRPHSEQCAHLLTCAQKWAVQCFEYSGTNFCLQVLKCALIVLAYLTYVGGEYIDYEDCGSKARLMYVQLDPCEDKSNCTVVRGQKVNFTVAFIPFGVITDVNPFGFIKLGDLDRPVMLKIPAGCANSGNICNQERGKLAIYRAQFEVSKELPKVLKCALLVLAYCIYADGTFVHYANCGSKAKVIWVQVDPCDDPYDCSLMKGGSVTFTVQLISDNAIKNLSSAAYVKLARLPHQVKLPVFGACENAGSTCNVQAGSAVTYRTQFLISKRLPKVSNWFLNSQRR
ncbi:ML domain protein, partial [Trichuris suis]